MRPFLSHIASGRVLTPITSASESTCAFFLFLYPHRPQQRAPARLVTTFSFRVESETAARSISLSDPRSNQHERQRVHRHLKPIPAQRMTLSLSISQRRAQHTSTPACTSSRPQFPHSTSDSERVLIPSAQPQTDFIQPQSSRNTACEPSE